MAINTSTLEKYVSASVLDGTGADLNNMLMDMGEIGDPTIMRRTYREESEWFCKIDVFADEGITFEVKSNKFDQPYKAVYNCIEKLIQTINSFKKGKRNE